MSNVHVILKRETSFCASHRLHNPIFSDEKNWEIFDKCNNPNGHGHNYKLLISLKGPINEETGMIMNITELQEIIDTIIIDKVDHQHLNKIDMFRDINPTAENMVITFWTLLKPQVPHLYELELRETDKNTAIYRGETSEE